MKNYELIALERELAELLGWTGLRKPEWGEYDWVGRYQGTDNDYVPKWCSDDAAAFQLMVEHDISPRIGTHAIVVEIGGYAEAEHVVDYLDKATVVRVAIVKAVITKLRSAQN